MEKIDPKEFRLKFFEETGFVRKQCPKCGRWFWTLNKDQVYCNDAPCVEYEFFNYGLKPLSVREARKAFIEFFRKHGHTPVKPKPVVARWREDLYLTIASIVDFQPFVTDGVVPPPANPLVVSQPCIRLEDIDNVGKTAGRHLTTFEMGGHHAFNYPDKQIYWKDETVRYAFEFFTKVIGVKPEDLTFKESWWEGGGNAGPCFEVTVKGLEVATLVFMQYKVVDGNYVPMPLKVVDTGYGIERIAWLTQGAPTGFHAIYGELVKKFFEKIGVEEPDEEIVRIAGKLSSTFDPDEPESIEKYYRRVAEEAKLPYEKAREILERMERVFAVLDHTKTLALMLADGIVPSNTGEGYLARLVLRRALRALAKLGSNVKLSELMKLQINFWGQDFPQLLKRRNYILEVVDLEEERFRKTLSRGLSYVERLLKRKKEISLEDLVELYDSHGIPPDIVEEVAKKKGVEVHIPANFFSIVARRHARAEVKEEKPEFPREVLEELEKLPPTRMLFHEDVYLRKFRAKVIYSKPGIVVLDKTAFYAEGGGQLSDVGKIKWGNRASAEVVHVTKVGDVIVHKLKDSVKVPVNIEVEGEIDWNRRYTLMRHHTATHIILGAARRVLGEHVWQAGAEKRPDKARLDITHYKPLSKDEIRKIEELANQVVFEGRKVTARFMDRNEAEAKYGLRLYQGGVPPGRTIRVVEVEGWDVEACFGTHVTNTREVGVIKIINVDRIQDGVVRLEYTVAENALKHVWNLEDTLESIAAKIGASPKDALLRMEKFVEEYKAVKNELAMFKREWVKSEAERALARKKPTKWGYATVSLLTNMGKDVVLELARKIIANEPKASAIVYNVVDNRVVVNILVGEEALRRGASAKEILAKILSKIVEGKGGGREDYAAASGTFRVPSDRVVEETFNILG